MTYEISNPSDPYTMKSDNGLAAVMACLILGEGHYGLTDRDGKQACPIFLFGGAEEWLKNEHATTIKTALDNLKPEIADALSSVLIGGFADRNEVESATAKMNAEDASKWLEERHDRRRSSMNNIGKRAHALAEMLREKATA